ncbi:MAG TPA: S8 family serine peptidase [Propionibacteriaceae bacterium]
MIRRASIVGLALVVGAAVALPAQAEPVDLPMEARHSRFQRVDLAKLKELGIEGMVPQLAQRDKTVSALVQLSTAPVAVQRKQQGSRFRRVDAERRVKQSQDAALPKLRAAGAESYGRLNTVLNAVQVRVKAGDLAALAKVPGVTKIQVSRTISRDNAAGSKFTGVDKTWQDFGYTGKGQKIAIVDSGIDYTHADFGGAGTVAAFKANNGAVIEPGSFPTRKVTSGYDFVGDDYDASSDDPAKQLPRPDPDPLDCDAALGGGHGSHVAGTAAGYGVKQSGATYDKSYVASTLNKNFKVEPGVAPLADLQAYRVFGCSGSVNDDIIVAAIDRAVSDGATVINMSLGSGIGTRDNLDDQAIKTATEAGVLVVTSAGNDGPGAYLVGAPSTSDTALSVAAVDAELATYPGAAISGAATAKGLIANQVALTTPITGELVDLGLGCDPADYAAVAGKIALTTRGTCDRVDRAKFGQEAGAKAVIMINTDSGLPPLEGPIVGVSIPFIGVSSDAGPALKAADGKSVTLSPTQVANPTYGQVADFSSSGPRFGDSAQKPDLAAPGVSVPSALSGSGSGFVRESGTSMSAPHTAGVAALVRQANPKWTPLRTKAVLMSTAAASKVVGFDSQVAGTGLVQPRRAVTAQAYASTSTGLNSLKFGVNQLSDEYSEMQAFQISNQSSRSVTYDLSAKLSSESYGADVTFSPKKVTVAPGKTQTVRVTVALSTSDVAKLPGADQQLAGVLTSLHGLVVAKPTTNREQTPSLAISMMFVPVPVSDVQSSPNVREVSPDLYSRIKVTNNGKHSGTADLYSWLLADPAGDASNADVADLTNVGVQSLPGTVVGESASDRFLVFAVSEAKAVSTHSALDIELPVDTNGDGEADYYVISVDTGLLTAGALDGTQTSFTLDANTGDLVDAWEAYAPLNGSTVLMPVLASAIGVTAASPPLEIGAAGFSALGAGNDPVAGSAFYDPFTPALNSGELETLAPGASLKLPVAVDESQLTSQTAVGWLVISHDDRSGVAEADRVRLDLTSPALKAARAKAKPGNGVAVTQR